jgi:hypothetical protein
MVEEARLEKLDAGLTPVTGEGERLYHSESTQEDFLVLAGQPGPPESSDGLP